MAIGSKRFIFSPRTKNLKEFDELCRDAKDVGATHVTISGLLERTDLQGEGRAAPWTEWSVRLPALFKHITPPGLEDAFPKDFVQRQMDFLRRKHDIAAKRGLKSAYFGDEPQWLIGRVYDKHPDWRGPRCDNSLRTISMHFAPCIDHPEVLECYRYAMREIIRQAPQLDTFQFMTNDSGAGTCWSGMLYVNPNGPTHCYGRPIADRVVGFLRALREGAAQAGTNAEIFLEMRYPAEEALNIMAKLEPGMNVMPWGGLRSSLGPDRTLQGMGGYAQSEGALVTGLPMPLNLVDGLFRARNAPVVTFGAGTPDDPTFTALNLFRNVPETATGTENDKMEFASTLAAAVFPPEITDEIVDAWYALSRAGGLQEAIEPWRNTVLGVIGMRWLVRPLVPHQELLSEEEKSYWLPYVYQSYESQPETFMDYTNQTGQRRFEGWSHVSFVARVTEGAAGRFKTVIAILEKALAKTSSEAAKARIRQDILCLRAQCCILMNIRNTVAIAVLGYEREKLGPITDSVMPGMPKDARGSPGLMRTYQFMRYEIDNINELISLMKQSPIPLLHTEKEKSQEGTHVYGPDLLENLQKKVKIMLRHWRDAEKGYYRPTLGG